MSSNDEEATLHELVIIRRRGGQEEHAHHGGVWKIAYADFMTAMMAFFLVMWLINATDKKVLTQVATYFNPLRLTDKAPTPRGLHDSDSGAPGNVNEPGHAKSKDGKAKGAKLTPAQQKALEQALFNDPYGFLEKLAKQLDGGQAKVGPGVVAAMRRADAATTVGEAFRDPFNPEFRQAPLQSPAKPVTPDGTEAKDTVSEPVKAGEPAADADQRAKEGAAAPVVEAKPREHADAGADAALKPDAPTKVDPTARHDVAAPHDVAPTQDTAVKQDSPAKVASPAAQAGAPARMQETQRADRAETERLEADIKRELGQMAPGTAPDIEVTVAEEGLLISLTDKFDFGMFAIASAEPRPIMVQIMEKIAKVLQARPGQIVVRGHTDGRPFRSATYDNWRLSTARAHMAYYMLVRGGIDEKRVARIEGYADRDLRVPGDPEAAQNRRIEILLRRPVP